MRTHTACGVLALAVLASCSTGSDERNTARPRSTKLFAPDGLGASLEIPASWIDEVPHDGTDFSAVDPNGDAKVTAVRTYATDEDRFAASSRDHLVRIGATYLGENRTTIDDQPTIVLRYSLPAGSIITQYSLLVGDGTAIQIAIGEEAPETNTALLAEIASSIAVGDVTTSVDLERVTFDDSGFVGEYRVRRDREGARGPAVLLLGGSGGGMPPMGIQLARAGYPTLSLAYFKVAGLPNLLADIPLEYFEGALRWLREQPDVGPDQIVVWGYSRGGEAALLVGSTYPDLVHGVVANVPANVLVGAYPVRGAAWTVGGEALPYALEFPAVDVVDAPEAEIPVERIAGPVLLTCGERDVTWASCPMSRAVLARLDAHGHPFRHDLLAYPDLGHFVNAPPFSILADVRDGDDAWRGALDFLAEVGLGPAQSTGAR